MDDIWTSIKIYMYPTKKKCIYDQYVNGDIAASNGYLNLIKKKEYISFTINAMNFAAKNGHLEVVEWLHLNRKEGCTVYAMDQAAENGHLEVVRWLQNNIFK